ncbi:hypothetical protein, partial [Mesorhizobium sp. M6A.T.Cr.TU.017.01.1.1]|uniref:hypothetical protein n=1 Tax=Mesorhizobium sp. M6A.T.Cr.TU.017.01.1.1 TaxID=2496774 RepID=UPI0019D41DD0
MRPRLLGASVIEIFANVIAVLTASAYRRRHLSGSAAFGAGAAVDHACPGAAVTNFLADAGNACRVGIGLPKLLGFASQLASQPGDGLVDF